MRAFVTAPLIRKSAICSATCRATFSCASSVLAPRCGVAMTLSMPNRMFSVAGSLANTSSAAPATCPVDSAAASATSSINPPRAQLMIRTPALVLFSASAEMMLRVASVSGVCRVMKSARASKSASSTFSMPLRFAFSGVRYGSKPTTRIFSPCARLATIAPILPQPMMPSTLPVISVPMNLAFSHLPACVEALAAGIWRASDNIMVTACSAVVTALP